MTALAAKNANATKAAIVAAGMKAAHVARIVTVMTASVAAKNANVNMNWVARKNI